MTKELNEKKEQLLEDKEQIETHLLKRKTLSIKSASTITVRLHNIINQGFLRTIN